MPVFRTPHSPVTRSRVSIAFAFISLLLPVVSWSAADDIKAFPNAQIDLQQSSQLTSYPVTSSAIKKVNGQITADSEQWLTGNLERILYLLPKGSSSEQAFQYFREQLLGLGVTPLFECERFSCGESNFWANYVFKIARLYGLDKAQSYFIGSQIEAGKTVYYLVYTVRRGNKREYALVDVFTEGQKADQSVSYVFPIDLPITADSLRTQKAYPMMMSITKDKVALITVNSSAVRDYEGLKTKRAQLLAARTAIRRLLINSSVPEERFYVQTQISQDSQDSIVVTVLQP